MRAAFTDLLFSWPPNGGADVELYHVLRGLQDAGVEVHLFAAHEEASTERGIFNPDQLPFPATRIDFTRRRLTPENIAEKFRNAVDTWQPDAVVVTHGFALKPSLIHALNHYPIAARYYAHELFCARDPKRYREGAPCPNAIHQTPDICRQCAFEGQQDAIRRGEYRSWTADWVAARAWTAAWQKQFMDAVQSLDAVLVNNSAIREDALALNENALVVTSGVDTDFFQPAAAQEKEKKVILMTGRCDDPLKGLDVLMMAGRHLADRRCDFEIQATHYDHSLRSEWFRPVGWLDHEETRSLYHQADICVVPSIWEEPFGNTAVEAMACGRPVCASRSGGLRETVVHTETGFLFEPGNIPELVKELEMLLENEELRVNMDRAGRRRVEEVYSWRVIIGKHWLPLLERLVS